MATADALHLAAWLTRQADGAAASLARYAAAVDAARTADHPQLLAEVRWGWAEALEEAGDPAAAAEQRDLAQSPPPGG